MHLFTSEMFQLSCQAWEQPFSFIGELYFPAALQRRPGQNTKPKMGRKLCSPFPLWPHALHTHGASQWSAQTCDGLQVLYQWSFWKSWHIFLASGLLQVKWLLYTAPAVICSDLPLTEVSCLMKVDGGNHFYYHCHSKLEREILNDSYILLWYLPSVARMCFYLAL